MDLNELYFRHQRMLMRAAVTPPGRQRKRSLDIAGACARRISLFQDERGATAASGWARAAGLDASPDNFLKEYRA